MDVRALWREGRIEEARLALVQATERSVYRFLVALVRDADAAQDLAQDTFVRAFQSLGSYRGEAALTSWILSIARNLALNRARRRKLESRWHVAAEEVGEVPDARAVVEPGEPRLLAALESLPWAQREAVVLFYLEDLGIEEVARLTGRPANTVKSDLRRARAALRAALEDRAAGAAAEAEDREAGE